MDNLATQVLSLIEDSKSTQERINRLNKDITDLDLKIRELERTAKETDVDDEMIADQIEILDVRRDKLRDKKSGLIDQLNREKDRENEK